MNLKKEYKLPNRDNFNVSLEKINNENEYCLKIKENVTYRILGNDEEIKAVDPSGGPFISIGYKVDNCIVKKIYKKNNFGIVFVLEKEKF